MLFVLAALAQSPAAAPTPSSATFKEEVQVPIWPGVAPGSEKWTIAEQVADSARGRTITNVVQPTITVFYPAPSKATGTAVIVCQGGGFRTLPDPTNAENVRYLTENGITAIVLKYRLMQGTPEELKYRERLAGKAGGITPEDINRDLSGDYMRPIRAIAAADGRQAVKLVRQHAAELGIAPDRIGVIGFSSGGVLATTIAVEHDAETRPDFVGTFYGAPPDDHFDIPADASPMYIATADDDPLTWSGAVLRYGEWHKAKRPVELRIYGQGGHGFRKKDTTASHWQDDFIEWLRMEGFLKPKS
jgi:acetyl esterase/lipase